MTPYAAARELVDAVDVGMRGWAERICASAGASPSVRSHFPPEITERTVVVHPYRLTLWPKLAETVESIPVLGAPAPRPGGQRTVPDAWRRVGMAATQCLREVFPSMDTPRGIVVNPTAPLKSLPKPLADWYAGRPKDDAMGWVGEKSGKPVARLPAMDWTPGIKVRLHYLLQVCDPPEIPETSSVGLLSALMLGTHLDRVIDVPLPPAPLGEDSVAMLRAIAASASGPAAEHLAAAVEEVTAVRKHRVPILPHESPASDDFSEIMRGLRRPLQPTLLLMLLLPLGDKASFSPSVSPAFATDALPREGAES